MLYEWKKIYILMRDLKKKWEKSSNIKIVNRIIIEYSKYK